MVTPRGFHPTKIHDDLEKHKKHRESPKLPLVPEDRFGRGALRIDQRLTGTAPKSAARSPDRVQARLLSASRLLHDDRLPT
jgi:hypothetical protein